MLIAWRLASSCLLPTTVSLRLGLIAHLLCSLKKKNVHNPESLAPYGDLCRLWLHFWRDVFNPRLLAQFVYKLGQICSERGAAKLSAALCWRNTSAHLEVPHLANRLPPAYRGLMSALLQGTQGIYSSQRKNKQVKAKKQKSPQKYRVYFALASCPCAREWGWLGWGRTKQRKTNKNWRSARWFRR